MAFRNYRSMTKRRPVPVTLRGLPPRKQERRSSSPCSCYGPATYRTMTGGYEIKLDGYRAIAFKSAGKLHLRSRHNNDMAIRSHALIDLREKLRRERERPKRTAPSRFRGERLPQARPHRPARLKPASSSRCGGWCWLRSRRSAVWSACHRCIRRCAARPGPTPDRPA